MCTFNVKREKQKKKQPKERERERERIIGVFQFGSLLNFSLYAIYV